MQLRLVGLDIGSTTTRFACLDATLATGPGGRPEIVASRECAEAQTVLTPFAGEQLDTPAILALAGIVGTPADGGSVLLTGLAAAAPNASEVAAGVQKRLGPDVIAVTAHDPGLESWVAFQAAARGLSLAEPERWFINLDIGGGTTNFAAGRAGEVERVGCVRVGARHVRVRADGIVEGVSEVGRAVLAHLNLGCERLSEGERETVATFFVSVLEAVILGVGAPMPGLVELPFSPPPDGTITLSGGVGELVGAPDLPMETFGDLGPRIARRIHASAVFGGAVRPAAGVGRATVLGLALHATEHAGSTVFADRLPVQDLPIRARVEARDAVGLGAIAQGGAVQLLRCPTAASEVRVLAARIAALLSERPVTLLVDADIALILGNLVTGWGSRPHPLVVLDALPPRPARVVRLRRGTHGGVDVRYFGFV